MPYHNDTMIKTQEDFFKKYMYLSLFIVRVRKGFLRVCVWEGVGDRTELQYIDPHSYSRQRYVILVLQMLNQRAQRPSSAGWWLSLLHLIRNFSGPQLNRGPRAPSAWCGFPYHFSSITPSDLQLQLTSVLTELYNSSTPTRSPTRFLESHVGSSSSGNNCHAVHR